MNAARVPAPRRLLLNWGISLALLLLLGLGVELLLEQYALRQFEATEQRIGNRAGEVRAALLVELSASLHLATGLASYIRARDGQLEDAELQPWLEELLNQGRYIRNIGLAPGNRISQVYPLAGNERVLGLYYPDIPTQWPAVQRIIASRTPLLDGPLPLIQGGNGLIYRVPVFVQDNGYWGMISTVIDYDRLYAHIQAVAERLGLSVQIQRSAAGPDEPLAEGHPVVSLPVEIAGAHWQLLARERTPHPTPLGWLRLLGWGLALIVSASIGLSLHAQHRQAVLLLALNRSQRQFRLAFEAAPQGLALLDAGGRLSTVNQALSRLLQRQPEELLGQSLASLGTPQSADRLRGLPGTTGAAACQAQLLDAGGRPIDVELSAATLSGEAGLAHSCILHIQDIRESKRLMRLQNEFVSTVSHELRTPLTAISGPLELINAGALGEVPEHLRQMLQIAQHNSQRLALLINDLLDIGKLEAGKVRFDLQPCPLQPLLEQALRHNQAYAAQYRVQLRQLGSCSAWVRVDEQRLQQVLANLLANAAKFSRPGTDVELFTEERGAHLRLCVRDQGSGVPADFQARIFQKFAQADASDTRQKGGTGLGLAISKEIIERMGGRIGFDSPAGQGATFWFELPQVQPATSASGAAT
ncbi:ATP-binding protein [Pseudomonas zhanjiangensis]|uniref:histidine kinase n=1 Tax=Pseudomonas zhanjiangensis TaxID=3239015 RepID=A0ABV3YRT9_9PSED